MSFHHKLKPIQYNACFAITVTIRGTSKLVQKTRNVLKNLQKQKCPKYLLKLIPVKTHAYITENVDNIHCFKIKYNFFKNSFFSSTLIEWNNLYPTLRNTKSFVSFKNNILKFLRLSRSDVLNCSNNKGIRLITRPRVGMSHLPEYKFKHNFQDCLNPICSCGLDIKSTSHFLLCRPIFNDERYTLLSALKNIDCKLLELTKSSLSESLLYGNTLFHKEKTHSF